MNQKGRQLTLPAATPVAPAQQPWTLYSDPQRWAFLGVLFLVTISSNFDYYVLGGVLEPLKREFQVSDTALGLLSGFCFSLCYAIAAIPFARWSDRGNRRTVLTTALAGWSVMTLLTGLARTFLQLGLSRVGVGALESGATPPAQSLIADYFPPERRSSALAIMLAGSSVGYLIGLALGGYIAATLGWRSAFLLAGAVGLILTLSTPLVLAEPRRQLGFPGADAQAESLGNALVRLRRKPSFVLTLVGLSIFYFFSYGVVNFLPSFMMRTLHASLEEVSLTWGIAVAVANLLGTLVGGRLAARLSKRDVRWYAWMSAIACLAGVPLYWLALSATHLWAFVAIEFVAEFVLWAGTFATWPAIHAICGNPRRGMAIAIAMFAYILLGSGFGPLAAGALSDALGATYGNQSLRYSLNIMTLALLLAALAFYLSGRSMSRDLED